MKDLLIKLSDDALSPAEARQLNDLLRGDPLACEVYLNQITLEAQLQRELAGDSRQQVEMPFQSLPLPVSTMRGKARFRLTRAWLAAAAMIALGTVLWHFLASPRTSLPVATVLFAEDCEWRSPGGIA